MLNSTGLKQKTLFAIYKNAYKVDMHKEIYGVMGFKEVDRCLVKSDSIRLKKNLWGMPILSVKINKKSHRFLIDTASQLSIIKINKNLQLPGIPIKKDVKLNGFGEQSRITKAVLIKEFTIGRNKLQDVLLFVKEEKNILFNLLRINGILGWDILSLLDFSIDNVNKTLNIISKGELKRFNENRYNSLVKSMIPIIFDNYSNRLIGIDSGSNKSWISDRSDYLIDNSLIHEKKILSVGVNGFHIDRKGYLKSHSLQLQSCTFNFKKLAISTTDFVPKTPIDLMLGTDVLKKKEFVFINSQNKFIVI